MHSVRLCRAAAIAAVFYALASTIAYAPAHAAGADYRLTSIPNILLVHPSVPAKTLREDASPEDIANLMKGDRIRRVPITDDQGEICGIVALADLERTNARSLKAEVSERVSTPH